MSEINQNNWNQHPNQVWSFQNMKELFSTQTLSKSNDPSSFDTKLNHDIENFEFDTLEGKSISIKDSFSETHADAFLVIKNEEIIPGLFLKDKIMAEVAELAFISTGQFF